MRMPVLFVGHGSPMNLIEDNDFTRGWKQMAADLPRPQAILAVSAHWYTADPCVGTNPQPELIYDYYGFPTELYELTYPVKGAADLGNHVYNLLGKAPEKDEKRGLDHGAWMPPFVMWPQADIPICQLSVQPHLSIQQLLEVGRSLEPLRDQGVLIMGSGNVVHNLGLTDYRMISGGYDWAYRFDDYMRDNIIKRDFDALQNYGNVEGAFQAIPRKDHFHPLFYSLGATTARDKVNVYNNQCTLGSVSMTSYLWYEPQAKQITL